MKQLSQNCGYKDLPAHATHQSVPETEIDLPHYLSRMDINMMEFYLK